MVVIGYSKAPKRSVEDMSEKVGSEKSSDAINRGRGRSKSHSSSTKINCVSRIVSFKYNSVNIDLSITWCSMTDVGRLKHRPN